MMNEPNESSQLDFTIELRTDQELLEFAFQLSSLCSNCSAKAFAAVLGAKTYCGIMLDATHDQCYADSRYILSFSIEILKDITKETQQQTIAKSQSVRVH